MNFEYIVALGWNIHVPDPNNSHRNFFGHLYLGSNRILVLVPNTIWSNLSFWSKNFNLIQIFQFDPNIPIWSKYSNLIQIFQFDPKVNMIQKFQSDPKLYFWSKNSILVQKFNMTQKFNLIHKFHLLQKFKTVQKVNLNIWSKTKYYSIPNYRS